MSAAHERWMPLGWHQLGDGSHPPDSPPTTPPKGTAENGHTPQWHNPDDDSPARWECATCGLWSFTRAHGGPKMQTQPCADQGQSGTEGKLQP